MRLNALLRSASGAEGQDSAPSFTLPVQVLVTANEINDQHGTGPLVKRILNGRRNIFCIRSRNNWGGHDFGDWNVKISQEGQTRPGCFRNVLSILAGKNVRSVLCVPFLVDEVMTSIAIKAAFNPTLCVYIMDDQNVAENTIPDELMRELLEKASLRLATHPELRQAYERKYGLPFCLLPAVVPAHMVANEPTPPVLEGRMATAALLGSFWDQSWFDRLCSALAGCGRTMDWYGNNRSPVVRFPPEDLARAGITALGVVPEERLAGELRRYPFVIVPVGALDQKESNRGVASLSLPGRILFAAATSHTPILVVGSERTCAARFVKHFGIGETAPYEASAVAAAMDRLSRQDAQSEMRRNAAGIARTFSDAGIVEWLATSIELGKPADSRFEDAFAGYDGN
jgi:hypothetical protein